MKGGHGGRDAEMKMEEKKVRMGMEERRQTERERRRI